MRKPRKVDGAERFRKAAHQRGCQVSKEMDPEFGEERKQNNST